MPNDKGVKTLILGGGLTGVCIARFLHERGHSSVILEKESRIGGLCQSETVDGFTFDTGGSHIIFSRDEPVLALMKGALGKNRDEQVRNTKIFYKGRYVKYPFENGLSELPREDLFFCLNEFIKGLVSMEKGEVSPPVTFRDWILATFGKGIGECYLIPYNEKIWNFPVDEMSAHWVEGRVPRPPVEDIVKSAIGIETEGYAHQSRFSYPHEGGIEALVMALAGPVMSSIRTDFTVRSVEKTKDTWVVSDGHEQVTADRLISTLPLQYLARFMEDLPEDVVRAIGDLKYNSIITVAIGVKGGVPPYSWAYIPSADLGLSNRISFPSNYSLATCPEGTSLILAEITYNEGDKVSGLGDNEILQDVTATLQRMGIADEGTIIFSAVRRHRFAYVVYDLAYQDNIAIIRKYFDGKGLHLCGRFSQFEYLNMDGCIRSALDLVGRIG